MFLKTNSCSFCAGNHLRLLCPRTWIGQENRHRLEQGLPLKGLDGKVIEGLR